MTSGISSSPHLLYRVDFERLATVQTALDALWSSRLPELKPAAEARSGRTKKVATVIDYSIRIEALAEAVFAMLTEADLLTEWVAREAEVDRPWRVVPVGL